MTRALSRRVWVILLAITLFLPFPWGSSDVQAQEDSAITFGPRDILPMFLRSLRTADLIILKDGSVLSGRVLTEEFTIELSSGTRALSREDLVAIVFESGFRDALDGLFLKNGEKLTGRLTVEQLNAETTLLGETTFGADVLHFVLFQLPLKGQRPPNPVLFFRQIVGFLNPLLVSVTKFDTLVFPDGRVVSIETQNRDELAFTITSSIFGTFTFTPEQIAWVEFGREPNQPDRLTLKNGDRISGTIVVSGPLQGTLPLLGTSFTLSEEEMRAELVRIIFKVPVRLLGGGGRQRISPEGE